MSITTITSRELNQDFERAKRATESGPVFISTGGKPTHVLLSIKDYFRLGDSGLSIVDALAMPEHDDIDFEPPKLDIEIRPAEFP